ncbi:hypothetical protein O3M35_010360 [Rhynocoris fuscipes]|uniref:Gustatory receptor n=1 Tax=Rhynocoris fuscipes TaxID=488301 RepID=A0AAW1CZL1_9HEMI
MMKTNKIFGYQTLAILFYCLLQLITAFCRLYFETNVAYNLYKRIIWRIFYIIVLIISISNIILPCQLIIDEVNKTLLILSEHLSINSSAHVTKEVIIMFHNKLLICKNLL